jgi:hypothetical protein
MLANLNLVFAAFLWLIIILAVRWWKAAPRDPVIPSPWWQNLLWKMFQLSVACVVFSLVMDAQNRPYYPKEGAGQTAGFIAFFATMAATFVASWVLRVLKFVAQKLRRSIGRKTIVCSGSPKQGRLARNNARALGRQETR